jgi:Histidine kinase-, DNA gyrase B-, and HSP90-like ATPase
MPDANAHPKKHFFIEMFTRDIPLLDCVLDLIDNCVDGLARTGRLKMHTISDRIFREKGAAAPSRSDRPHIRVEFDGTHFQIADNCGGIDYDYALKDVFNFGHSTKRTKEYFGVYGVGMKRALFKMGDRFRIDSKTLDNGFSCDLDVPQWMANDSTMEDWTIPLTPSRPATAANRAGTTITVSRLKENVSELLASRRFEEDLSKAIGRVYAFIVEKHVRISVNGVDVKAFSVPVAQPQKGNTSYEEFKHDGVLVRILATLASPSDEGPRKENSGWYVACNGRLVLIADTSDTTGWGIPPMPIWVPKFTSFIGFVFFESKDALSLPWTTTKRGVNRESTVYRKAISRMAVLARPILSFCNRKYGPDTDQTPIEREIAKQMRPTTIAQLVHKTGSAFQVDTPKRATAKTTVRVQYDADITDVDKIKKHLRKPRLRASKIGEYTFDYFLRQEGLK